MNIHKIVKLWSGAAGALLLTAFVVSCKTNVTTSIAVTGVTLDKATVTLAEQETVTLKATVKPANAANKKVTWSSNKPDVAAVDKDGKVTAHKAGEAVITVKSEDGGKTASCKVTVTAKAPPTPTYAVSFSVDGTGGTLKAKEDGVTETDKSPISVEKDKTVIFTAKPADGYEVEKWMVNGTAVANNVSTTYSHKVTEKIEVKVSFKALPSATVAVTGVTLNKSALTLEEGKSEQLKATVKPANATNKAVTWSSDKSVIASVDANGTVTAHKAGEATITVTTEDGTEAASCTVTVTLTEYAITYHLNGGTNDSINPASYNAETLPIILEAAERTGCTFKGWYDNAACSGKKVKQIVKGSTGNKALWAKWEALTYSITYNLNGGSHSGNPAHYTVETETITLKDAAKANYTFAGWYEKADFSGEKVTQIVKGSSGNKELWAKFLENYTITYHLDEGSNHAGNPAKYTVETETITLKDASKANYTFAGWYDNAGCSGSPIPQITKGSTGNKALWAKFLENYNITYNLDGGSHSGNPAHYTVETGTITLKDAERTGYSFMGWYEKADFTGEKVTQIGKGSTGDRTFWAKWEIKKYDVIFSVEGTPVNGTIKAEVDGNEIHTNDKVEHGKKVIFTAIPTSSGYVIGTWEVTPKKALIRNEPVCSETEPAKCVVRYTCFAVERVHIRQGGRGY